MATTWPSSPSNGDKFTQGNGTVYVYNSATTSWKALISAGDGGGQTEAQVKALIADSEIQFRALGVNANTTFVYKSGSLLSAGEMLTIKPTDINGLPNRQQILVNLNETNAQTRADVTKGGLLRVTEVVSEVLPVTTKSDYKIDDVEVDDAFLRITVIMNPVRFIAGLNDFFNDIVENSDTTYSFEVIAFNDGVGVAATDHPGLMPILPNNAYEFINGVGAFVQASSNKDLIEQIGYQIDYVYDTDSSSSTFGSLLNKTYTASGEQSYHQTYEYFTSGTFKDELFRVRWYTSNTNDITELYSNTIYTYDSTTLDLSRKTTTLV